MRKIYLLGRKSFYLVQIEGPIVYRKGSRYCRPLPKPTSTNQLEKTIKEYLETYNKDSRPFVWTKTADEILENLRRYCERINDSEH